MVKTKYYAVAKGRETGIFRDWATTKAQVDGFTGARYKSFSTEQEAQSWLADLQKGTPINKKTTATNQQSTRSSQFDAANQIRVYTDGGNRNTGNVRGGHVKTADLSAWAYLIVTPAGECYDDTAGEHGATNNKMELTALKSALTRLQQLGLQQAPILMTLDSHYVLDPITKGWLAGWQRRGWKKSNGEPVLNLELWQQISDLLPNFTQLNMQWAKGHATNDGNNYVDQLLNRTMDQM
ncbi:ribonuclease H family protein [Lapidilactobacillus bayanensis]|uniref:ribonuclease H family protein n=1 Tax=Lapidilactobacillus bayanensis TaxID=2485998 RepID=UPI000F77C826|nr:ribonuclease H family protein [Lapidilactobacillus bayanensis]